jgi:hypothetical protein
MPLNFTNVTTKLARLERTLRARGLDRPPSRKAEDMSDQELLAVIERQGMHNISKWLARHRDAIAQVPGGPALISQLAELLAALPPKHPKNLLALWQHMEGAKLADAFLQVLAQLRETEVESSGGRKGGGGE